MCDCNCDAIGVIGKTIDLLNRQYNDAHDAARVADKMLAAANEGNSVLTIQVQRLRAGLQKLVRQDGGEFTGQHAREMAQRILDGGM